MNADSKVGPFFKWTGGKTRLLPEIHREVIDALMSTNESPKRVIEPFVGGGAFFFDLDKRTDAKIWLNDINSLLVRTYRAVRDNVDAVLKELTALQRQYHEDKDPESFYYALRDKGAATPDAEDVAAWFLFLNKTCFNGLYRTNKNGDFNVPWGKKKRITFDHLHIRACSEYMQSRKQLLITNEDFESIIGMSGEGDVVYCDPPYIPTDDQDESFTNYDKKRFTDHDQVRLVNAVLDARRRGAVVVMSNSDCRRTRFLYDETRFHVRTIEVARLNGGKAKTRKKTTELILRAK